MLPLDLHVLGLPLAFILSQDQTLHCIKINVLLESWLLLLVKELTDKYYNFLSLKTSKSKNRLKNPRSYFRNGKWCKGKSNILNLQIFQELFLQSLFEIIFRIASEPLCAALIAISKNSFPDCGCKGRHKFDTCKLFRTFFHELWRFFNFSAFYLYYILRIRAHLSRRRRRPCTPAMRTARGNRRGKFVFLSYLWLRLRYSRSAKCKHVCFCARLIVSLFSE